MLRRRRRRRKASSARAVVLNRDAALPSARKLRTNEPTDGGVGGRLGDSNRVGAASSSSHTTAFIYIAEQQKRTRARATFQNPNSDQSKRCSPIQCHSSNQSTLYAIEIHSLSHTRTQPKTTRNTLGPGCSSSSSNSIGMRSRSFTHLYGNMLRKRTRAQASSTVYTAHSSPRRP